ncbi:MAG: hypothetical protein HN726_00490 [Candidatus Magasanikbacteria bacterium]|jgi:membrane protein insertase Oxa1/YidC/SpoIIIJ|nr:hypothetical protein [Candidatus Magasanikbacteria bacterium]MBT4221101.1 hypothetical protein [Candidatus Magasanikbacteria bacterium]MBT4350555.1 hypothetical protein [Candidatus Magasanikbacteria bacterium]MBT4542146.1 hypothetical protein [Candidatus Magasanikbacteria bacterium]MBT6253268.1 hypothetical protein [Candidatus Magasanikbacteria bacterium]
MILIDIWQNVLYEPLFNFLIWIYNDWSGQNMGWAIIILTIIIRFALLPFTILNEYSKVKNTDLYDEIERVGAEYKNDPILKKQEIRRVLKKRKVYPWATVIVLGIQGLTLVLLYQVFLNGITGDKILESLYPFVNVPGTINTLFFGVDLETTKTLIGPGIITGLLFLQIFIGFRKSIGGGKKSDLAYAVIFPSIVFLVLWWLPAVKSLFIFTTMAFSMVVGLITRFLFKQAKGKKEEKKQTKK